MLTLDNNREHAEKYARAFFIQIFILTLTNVHFTETKFLILFIY